MIKVLFVCMGNICRSPAAEAIMRKMVEKAQLSHAISCASAGLIGYHQGELPDARMREHGARRGYQLNSRARQFNPQTDFENFDYILVMDDSNLANIRRLDPAQRYQQKVAKMTDFANQLSMSQVPDPYYGGERGFELVLDILEDAIAHFLAQLQGELASKP